MFVESERFLVTGALGCIGAWAVKQLVDAGVPVWTYDLPGSDHRLRLVLRDEQFAQVTQTAGDITDQAAFERAVVDNGITRIVHLAGLQVPFVRADPVQGARVNVVGTTIVFETVKRHADQVRGLSYASSLGVYGAPELYPPGPLAHDAPLHPPTLYGVFKQANEGTAQIYWDEYRVRSIGLRPYIVYGPGRDQGMTSTPTKAMLAAALGRTYHISYGGRAVFQHAYQWPRSWPRSRPPRRRSPARSPSSPRSSQTQRPSTAARSTKRLARRTGYHWPRACSKRSRTSAPQRQPGEWMSNEPLLNSN